MNIYGYTWAILAYAFPHLALSNLTNSRVQGRHRYSFWNEIYEAVLAPYILFPTLLALISPRLGRFNVTSKGGVIRRSYFDRRIALPYLLLLAFNITGLVMAEHRFVADPAHRDTVAMNAAWTLYSTMILAVAASVAWEKRKLRSSACLRMKLPASLKLAGGGYVHGVTNLLSRTSVTVKVDAPVELARGTPVVLSLGDARRNCEIPALVAHSSGQHQHLFLRDLTEQQEDHIEGLVYRRRRAWRSLHAIQPKDRPLRSLLQIFFLAIRGLVIVPIGFFLPSLSVERDPLPPRRGSRAASELGLILLIAVMLPSWPVRAMEIDSNGPATSTQKTDGIPPADFHDEFQLGAAGNARVLSLQKSGASLNFFFGESVTKVATNAILKLSYSAPDLHAHETTLELTLNGGKVGSIALVPGPSQQAEFALPTDLLTNDNTLSVELQGSCPSCDATRKPWVTLDPNSTVVITGTRLPLANDLSLLPLPFFDPSALRSWNLPVVFGDQPDDITLESAALVASHFGILSDVRGVHFPVSVGEFPKGNAVVLALRKSKVIAGLSLPAGQGPLLAMRDNPDDPYGKLLVLTGDRPQDLLDAARGLASASWMPHRDSLRIQPTQPAALQEYGAPRWLQADRPSAIGTYTTAEHLQLHGTGSINLYFRFPPDLFLLARESVPLLVKFQYSGAPAGSKPAIHISLNGRDIDSVQLKPTSTPLEEAETFRLPTGSLLAYTNTLTVDFYFQGNTPPNANPSFAIDRETSLDLRGLPHSAVVPRLELFADAGYPYTKWPDGSETAVILPRSPTPNDYEALLDMEGFLGAQTGTPATQLTVADVDQVDAVQDKDLVLLGTTGSQPLLSQWAGAMPVSFTPPGMQVNEAKESTLLSHPEWPFRGYDGRRLRRLIAGDVNADLFVESFVSPLRADRLVVAIIPTSSNGIEAIRALFTPSEREGPVYGGVAISQKGRFESFLVGTTAYHAGELDRYQFTTVLLIENYWLIPLILLFLALAIAVWVRWSTERVATQRLATWET